MRYAIIKDGVVVNVILWDGQAEWQPPEGATLVNVDDIIFGPGYLYDGETFTDPSPPLE